MSRSSATPIQAITFDVGGTLLDPWPSVGHIYAEVAAQHGIAGLDPVHLQQRFVSAWSALPVFPHTRAEWSALVDTTFLGLTAVPPSTTFFDPLYERFAFPASWRLGDDVRPILDRLSATGLRLGVISDWDERLRPLLQRFDLTRYFDPIIVSCEAGYPKPDPRIFAAAAQRWQLPPAAILHVGDSPTLDVAGARDAGFRAVLLDRKAPVESAGVIRSLMPLAGFVGA
jgi:putative hydrolase of the HAD superfamily